MEAKKFVGIILVNRKGEILLQLRPDISAVPYAGYWTLPGGKVEQDEEVEDAIVREVEEETGYELRNFKLFRKIQAREKNRQIERYVYEGTMEAKAEELKLGEGVKLQYFSCQEIDDLNIAFDLKPILKEFCDKKKFSK